MKKLVCLILVVAIVALGVVTFTACNDDNTIVVFTNAFFAPFEYYGGTDGTDIVGVDVDIMKLVGEEMGKKVVFENKDFATLIDFVEEGKLCDCSAAGFTITEARLQKVNFSIPYYTSVQYVIFEKDAIALDKTAEDDDCVFWAKLEGKKIGVQLDTTGNFFVDDEIDEDEGVLNGKGSECKPFDDAQLAYGALKAGDIDCVVVDELPAKYLVKNTSDYVAYPLYYDADEATSEEYGIAVNKKQTALLEAINKVLQALLDDVDTDGNNGVERLVINHFKLED